MGTGGLKKKDSGSLLLIKATQINTENLRPLFCQKKLVSLTPKNNYTKKKDFLLTKATHKTCSKVAMIHFLAWFRLKNNDRVYSFSSVYFNLPFTHECMIHFMIDSVCMRLLCNVTSRKSQTCCNESHDVTGPWETWPVADSRKTATWWIVTSLPGHWEISRVCFGWERAWHKSGLKVIQPGWSHVMKQQSKVCKIAGFCVSRSTTAALPLQACPGASFITWRHVAQEPRVHRLGQVVAYA